MAIAIYILLATASAWLLYFQATGDAFFFHTVPEGHVGVYKRFGAILPQTTQPGLHFLNPLTTSVDMVQVTLQTDTVSNIPCGTSGGVNIYFDKIEVVNKLEADHVYQTIKDYGIYYDQVWIFDKIHHEINQFCSSHSLQEVYIQLFDKLDESLAQALQKDCDKYDTGISIISIRVTKPKIPESILKEFESVEERKAELLVLEQEQAAARIALQTDSLVSELNALKHSKVAQIQAERDRNISKIAQQQKTGEVEAEAERKALVSRIHQTQLTSEAQQQAERERVDNLVAVEIAKNKTALWFERATREVEIERIKLTPQYYQSKLYEETGKALGTNTKLFFGKKMPTSLFSFLPKSAFHPEDLMSPIEIQEEEPNCQTNL